MTANQPPRASETDGRLVSLDAFRGAAIAAMILVNNPGKWSKVYTQLRHAQWNGWTFADCVFPFFLFIVGVAIALSTAKRKDSNDSDGKTLRRILRRTCILFGLGLLLNAFPDFHVHDLRIPGVLQRIAICYLIASVIVLKSQISFQVSIAAGLLVSYSLMLEFIPVPGIGAGSLEPGTNLASYIDGLLLPGHLWYNIRPFDPEGILSTIPAIGTTLLGGLTGHWLLLPRSVPEKAIGMVTGGILLLAAGQILNNWLPINKGIWTSSFAIFTAGMALVCLAVFCWLMDVKGYRRPATPFQIFGMNAIAAYVLSELLSKSIRTIKVTQGDGTRTRLKTFIFDNLFAPLASSKLASLIFALTFVFLMFLVVWGMWRKRLFLKV